MLQFFGAVALGSAASAVLGALGTVSMLAGAHYLREWQLWWAGNWLGSLSIAPVVLCWAVRWRAPLRPLPRVPAVELVLVGAALLGMTIWVFTAAPGGNGTYLDPPFLLLALMVAAAFRLPPRWSTVLAAAVALLASYFASRGLGPFAGDPNPFVRVGAAQLYLATLVMINFMLTIVVLEMRNTLQLLGTAGERYRNFVEHSSEAVWRIELRVPMPGNLPVEEQIAWLREHADIAECNLPYRNLNRQAGMAETDASMWRTDLPWSAIFLQQLETSAQRGYSVDGPSLHRAEQFRAAHVYHGIPRRHRGGKNWRASGESPAMSRSLRNSTTVCARTRIACRCTRVSWSARKNAPVAQPQWICMMG